ncbi:MAG: HEAT repeat domain-containing protein [Lentisphaeria bacterium]|nr:HEAT repeat domain-containing protein [Lentisphaeria bacterium]
MNWNRTPHILCAGILVLAGLPVRGTEEDNLIAILRSGATTAEKCAACQRLRQTGTPRAVPALGELLDQERTAHAACQALDGIPGGEAAATLRQAAIHRTGPVRLLAIDCLGRRADTEAIPSLAALTRDADPATAAGAAMALGRIGGPGAAEALLSARKDGRANVRDAAAEGLLRGAERALGEGDPAAALRLYRSVLDTPLSNPLRSAAWCGMVLADAKEGPNLLLEALANPAAPWHAMALSLVRETEPPQYVQTCLTRWDSLPDAAQVAVLEAHLRRGAEALPTVQRGLRSPHARVRAAAMKALLVLPHPPAVPALAEIAATAETQEREAARQTLAAIEGEGIRDAILHHLAVAEPPLQAELLRTLGRRGDRDAAEVLLRYARETTGPVRNAALAALGDLACETTLGALLDLAATSPAEDARSPALAAAGAVCRASRDRETATDLLLDAARRLPATERSSILPLFGAVPAGRTMNYLFEAAKTTDPEISREAVRTLSGWPDLAPASGLLELARTHGDGTTRVLALRGAIELAGREPDPGRKLAALREILPAAGRSEEKRLAIAALGQIPTPEALATVLLRLADPDVVNEAAAAALDLAQKLAEASPEAARNAVAQVLAAPCNDTLRARAAVLRGKPQAGPFLRHWLVSGPYAKPGAVGAEGVFDVVFPPEREGAKLEWQQLPVADHPNLSGLFPGRTDCAAYLRARVLAPREADALLLLGSDDGIKAWLNGTPVFGNNVDRPITVDGDVAAVRLRQGENTLLLKITQGQGGWMASARFVGLDGSPIPGLQDQPWEGTAYAQAAPAAAAAAKPAPQAQASPTPAALPPRQNFRRLRLFEEFYAEGAYYGDFNRDGRMDVVAGPFWFEGPDLQTRHEYRPVKAFDPKGYSDNFLTYAGDFNADGWTDILAVPFPGREGYWYANPRGAEGHWKTHRFYDMVGNESPMWGDVTGDGVPELLFCNEGYLGYAGPDPGNPDAPWVFRPVSGQDRRYQKFTHGIGFGDLNGDGRVDMLEGVGWWEQPADPQPGQTWLFHPQRFAEAAAQMLVDDLDGDGLPDVVSAWHCHHYGLVWYRQKRDADGTVAWEQNTILTPQPDLASNDLRISQLHAFELVDMNGDGHRDILTGKRFWAHGPTGDKEPDAPAVVLWFERHRDGQGGVNFLPRLVDDDSGVGTQVTATDLNGDGRPDVIVANKKGGFVHLSQP